MKPRRAAALALVGWYLIAPPPRASDDIIDPKAPLSEWQKIGKFDTIEDCRKYPAREPEIMHGFYVDNKIPESSERNDKAAWNYLMAHAQCVSTDDRRLKQTK